MASQQPRKTSNESNESSNNDETDNATPSPVSRSRLNPTSAAFNPNLTPTAFDSSSAFNNLNIEPSSIPAFIPSHLNFITSASLPRRNPSQSQPQLQQPNAGTSSRWTSPATRTNHEFARIQTNAKHLGLTRSPVFPKNVAEFNRHRAEFGADLLRGEREALEVRMREVEGRQVSGEKDGSRGRGDVAVRQSMVKMGVKEDENEDAANGDDEEEISDEEGGHSKPSARHLSAPSRSKILALRTDTWAGDEEALTEGHRKHNWDRTRSSWPDSGEYKLEGDSRSAVGFQRRLPRPKIDARNQRALRWRLGDLSELTYEEAVQRVRETSEWSAEELAVWEKAGVNFQAQLDRLVSVDVERENDMKMEHGLATLVLEHHGSLAVYIAGQAKVAGHAVNKQQKKKKKSRAKNVGPLGVLGGGYVAFDGAYVFPTGTLDEDPADESLPADGMRMPRGISSGTHNFDSMSGPPVGIMNATPQESPVSAHGIGAGADAHSLEPQPVDMDPPSGGWRFNEDHLRAMHWGDILDEVDGKERVLQK